ncbi:MAG: presenilin family intramembrane aspartyl protease PSH [Candidatus Bathyarchaeia archaeon]
MNEKVRTVDILPVIAMGGLIVLVNCLALAVAGPFEAAGEVAFINPSDPWNLVFFFVVLVVFTAVILLIAKYGKKEWIQAIFIGATGIFDLYVFYPLFNLAIPDVWVCIGLSIALTAVIVALLYKYPEWYVVDISAALTGVGAIAILGISLTVLMVIILLIVMALYDAISVYKTKHMIDLADTLVDLKLPVLFVIPKKRGYSLLEEKKRLKQKLDEGEKREAFFMGTGDIVIPGILAAAVFHSLPSDGLLVALSVVAGGLVGFAVLMIFVFKGKPQAGLPFLVPGVILGYVVSSFLLFGGLEGLGAIL